MPGNTTNPNPGTPVNFQNPATTSLELDSEVIGTNLVSGAQITREFIISEDSITGQTDTEVLIPVLNRILSELRGIRLLMEAEAAPQIVDEIDDVFALEEAEIEVEES